MLSPLFPMGTSPDERGIPLPSEESPTSFREQVPYIFAKEDNFPLQETQVGSLLLQYGGGDP